MTRIQILPEDVADAAERLAQLEQGHGAPRTLELAAAEVRASAAYLAKWTGPSPAAHLLAAEAHGLVAEAASELAIPRPPQRGRKRRLLTLGRAAAWVFGTLTGFVLGLGVSAWALGY